MPSSLRSLSQTIGFFALGFSEKPASGSSFGNSTMPVSSEAIFIGCPSLLMPVRSRSGDLQRPKHRQPRVDEFVRLAGQLGQVVLGRFKRGAVLHHALVLRGEKIPGTARQI